ncbi:MAG: hypothetical protein HC925_07120 [Coleofasciculaceae cyanobacterium SM2_3_26]|nr:hypothetical protein [Coleofasciculaceae cyanobacterium SM2_3_26]
MSLSDTCLNQHHKENEIAKRWLFLGLLGATGVHAGLVPLLLLLPPSVMDSAESSRIELIAIAPSEPPDVPENVPEPEVEVTPEPPQEAVVEPTPTPISTATLAPTPTVIEAAPAPTLEPENLEEPVEEPEVAEKEEPETSEEVAKETSEELNEEVLADPLTTEPEGALSDWLSSNSSPVEPFATGTSGGNHHRGLARFVWWQCP